MSSYKEHRKKALQDPQIKKEYDALQPEYDNKIGCILRKSYESGYIKTESEFNKELEHVLSGC